MFRSTHMFSTFRLRLLWCHLHTNQYKVRQAYGILYQLTSLLSTTMSLPRRKFIIDCDTGTDDAQAIMMALGQSDVDLIAVTTVFGNAKVEDTFANSRRILQFKGRPEIPVYQGSERSMLGQPSMCQEYHGKDGLGDIVISGVDPISSENTEQEHAAKALIRIVDQYPDQVTLVATGPLTNIALALHLDPMFGHKLQDIYVMGGNIEAKGNVTQSAEFNFFSDPEAVYFILENLGRKITLATMEVCEEHGFSWEWYEKFTNGDSKTSKLIQDFERDMVNREIAKDVPHYIMVWDQVAMATAINNQVATETKDVYATIELQGQHTRGQLVIDWRNKLQRESNVRLIKSLDKLLFKKLMYSSLTD